MKIRCINPLFEQEFDDAWVDRHLRPIRDQLRMPDIHAVTLHRETGDYRYEEIVEEVASDSLG